MSGTEPSPLFQLKGIYKHFADSQVTAVNFVDFDLAPREIHALVGENGSGKSTLMKILAGIIPGDQGAILTHGLALSISSPEAAQKQGIGMIQQHPLVIAGFRVWENIVLGAEPKTASGSVNKKTALEKIHTLCQRYNIDLDPDAFTYTLTSSQIQKLSLVAMLYRNLNVLILDEATSTLTDQEVAQLFDILRKLKDQGKSIILITHKIREVFMADRVTVMRKGEIIATKNISQTTPEELSLLMIGTSSTPRPSHRTQPASEIILAISKLSVDETVKKNRHQLLHDISFSIHKGETVGITGIRESGLELFEDVIFGIKRASTGSIVFRGENITNAPPAHLRRLGISYIPTDRLIKGASLSSTVAENMLVLTYKSFQRYGFFNQKRINSFVNRLQEEFNIKAQGAQSLSQLSGGNIQKVILSRELSGGAYLIFFSEPSWGLDAKSTDFIYGIIQDLKRKGASFLIISTDLDEVLALSDRIAVISQGEITTVKERGRFNRSLLGEYILGLRRDR